MKLAVPVELQVNILVYNKNRAIPASFFAHPFSVCTPLMLSLRDTSNQTALFFCSKMAPFCEKSSLVSSLVLPTRLDIHYISERVVTTKLDLEQLSPIIIKTGNKKNKKAEDTRSSAFLKKFGGDTRI